MDLTRGALVTVALQGDYGKPRPALVIQSDLFAGTETVVVLLVSSTLIEAPQARVTVQPSARNGLRVRSQIMVDKPIAVARRKVGSSFGRLDDEVMLEATRALALFLGIAA